jgi:hypothetical protein
VKFERTSHFLFSHYKNCVHCVYVTTVYRTLEEGMKSTRFKCKLLAFILFVSMQ